MQKRMSEKEKNRFLFNCESSVQDIVKTTPLKGVGIVNKKGANNISILPGGVSTIPEFHHFQMKPGDEWYVILATDGLWEFLTAEDLSKVCGKKLRLKGTEETVKYCIDLSQKRWNIVEEDKYCDDIT